ncbi:ribosomal L28 family-domain-containing protein [Amylostereum chailletii]|nr:ribosomal L28 family-domain-containing protein [Amylostereum chailletii]
MKTLAGSHLPFSVFAPPPASATRPSASGTLTLSSSFINHSRTPSMFPSLPSFTAAVVSQPFKRAQLGLFHGKMKQYGNNVPHSKQKTRRTWLPNIQSKRIFSDALGENVRVKVSTRALKTIKKVCPLYVYTPETPLTPALSLHLLQYGSLDAYVLQTKTDLLGWEGMRLRVLVREAQERKIAEAANPSP